MISYLIDNNKNVLNYFYYFLFITYFILVFDGFVQYFYGSNLVGLPINGVRVSSFFGDELIMGSYLSRLFPLFFALFILRSNKSYIETFSFYILLILTYLMVFMSGERASFFFINLILFFCIFFIRQQKALRFLLLIFAISSVFFLAMNDSKYYKRFIQEPIKSFGLEKGSEEKYIFTPEHDSLYRTAWNMFVDRPIIGQGPKLFREKCSDKKFGEGMKTCDTHPHNFYIQILAETGIVGFYSYLVFCIFLSKVIQNAYRIILKKLQYSVIIKFV